MVYPAFAIEYDLNSYHVNDDSDENIEYDQIVSTSDGTLDVGIYTIPKTPNTEGATQLKISFLKPGTEKIQLHIDYRVSVTKDGDYVFGPMSRLLHTSPGSITIPVQFSENGSHVIQIEVEGILFQPIPLETATFTMNIGQAEPEVTPTAETSIPGWIKNNAGWWATDQIDDSTFLQGIQYLIQEEIMIIPPTETSESSDDSDAIPDAGQRAQAFDQRVPAWIKNNAGWWATDQIDDSAFLQGIQYLVQKGIIVV